MSNNFSCIIINVENPFYKELPRLRTDDCLSPFRINFLLIHESRPASKTQWAENSNCFSSYLKEFFQLHRNSRKLTINSFVLVLTCQTSNKADCDSPIYCDSLENFITPAFVAVDKSAKFFDAPIESILVKNVAFFNASNYSSQIIHNVLHLFLPHLDTPLFWRLL